MITIRDLHRKWNEFVLSDITLNIHKGEYFVILGPTGAGKTLLLEVIAGFYQPDGGEIFIAGKNITQLPPEKRDIGFVYQDYSLFPHMNVAKNIKFGMRMKGIKDHSRIEHIADYLNISPILHRHPQTLSGGEKQRVALSRALVIEPDVLLLDEPLSALDPRAQETTRKILKKINNESNITVIHVTHNQTEARILADRIAIMMNGKIEQVGTPEEIFNKPNNGQVAHFVGVENIFKGTVTSVYNGIAQIHVGSITIEAVTEYPVGETVNLCLRPENIILSKTLSKSSARNSFEGEITEIEDMGALARVNVACDDVMLHALVTTQSARSLELMQQERVIASFKATAVHVL